VGWSTAYHLAAACGANQHDRADDIVVLERNPTGGGSSALHSVGGLRQQFSLKENVQMSLYGRDFMRQSRKLLRVDDEPTDCGDECDVHFQEHGYLFLAATPAQERQMRANHRVQRDAAGSDDIVLLEPAALRQRFPWLRTDDLVLGSFGQRGEGWLDPWALLQGLRRKCRSMGVRCLHGAPVAARRDAVTGRVASVDIRIMMNSKTGGSGDLILQTVTPEYVVNAAGAHCAALLELLAGGAESSPQLQHPLPVRPRKRSVFVVHCGATLPDETAALPLTVDPGTGVYVRSEGDPRRRTFLCGVSPSVAEDVDYECSVVEQQEQPLHADHELFDNIIWPALYHRVPAFGNLKVQSSWAGLYEYNTVDQNAIIAFHPELPNVLCVNGFSGHGLQHSPAAGRAAAELLVEKRFQTLDLSIFGYDRCRGLAEPVLEVGIV